MIWGDGIKKEKAIFLWFGSNDDFWPLKVRNG
jgi:hypothetical protein